MPCSTATVKHPQPYRVKRFRSEDSYVRMLKGSCVVGLWPQGNMGVREICKTTPLNPEHEDNIHQSVIQIQDLSGQAKVLDGEGLEA